MRTVYLSAEIQIQPAKPRKFPKIRAVPKNADERTVKIALFNF